MKTISKEEIVIENNIMSVLDVYHEVMRWAHSYDVRHTPHLKDLPETLYTDSDICRTLYKVAALLEMTKEVNP